MNIQQLSYGRYRVQSRTDPNEFYLVKYLYASKEFTCDCPDGLFRSAEGCWHIQEVKKRFEQ